MKTDCFESTAKQTQVILIRKPLHLEVQPLAHTGAAILETIIRRRCLQGLRVGLECYHLLFYHLCGKIFGTPFRFPQSRHAASNRQYVQRFISWSILAANQRK